MFPQTVWRDTYGGQGNQCKIAMGELGGDGKAAARAYDETANPFQVVREH